MARSKQGVFLIGADCAVALSNKRESSTIMLDNPSSSGDSSSLLRWRWRRKLKLALGVSPWCVPTQILFFGWQTDASIVLGARKIIKALKRLRKDKPTVRFDLCGLIREGWLKRGTLNFDSVPREKAKREFSLNSSNWYYVGIQMFNLEPWISLIVEPEVRQRSGRIGQDPGRVSTTTTTICCINNNNRVLETFCSIFINNNNFCTLFSRTTSKTKSKKF